MCLVSVLLLFYLFLSFSNKHHSPNPPSHILTSFDCGFEALKFSLQAAQKTLFQINFNKHKFHFSIRIMSCQFLCSSLLVRYQTWKWSKEVVFHFQKVLHAHKIQIQNSTECKKWKHTLNFSLSLQTWRDFWGNTVWCSSWESFALE